MQNHYFNSFLKKFILPHHLISYLLPHFCITDYLSSRVRGWRLALLWVAATISSLGELVQGRRESQCRGGGRVSAGVEGESFSAGVKGEEQGLPC